jgi:hypothetical protein
MGLGGTDMTGKTTRAQARKGRGDTGKRRICKWKTRKEKKSNE